MRQDAVESGTIITPSLNLNTQALQIQSCARWLTVVFVILISGLIWQTLVYTGVNSINNLILHCNIGKKKNYLLA